MPIYNVAKDFLPALTTSALIGIQFWILYRQKRLTQNIRREDLNRDLAEKSLDSGLGKIVDQAVDELDEVILKIQNFVRLSHFNPNNISVQSALTDFVHEMMTVNRNVRRLCLEADHFVTELKMPKQGEFIDIFLHSQGNTSPYIQPYYEDNLAKIIGAAGSHTDFSRAGAVLNSISSEISAKRVALRVLTSKITNKFLEMN